MRKAAATFPIAFVVPLLAALSGHAEDRQDNSANGLSFKEFQFLKQIREYVAAGGDLNKRAPDGSLPLNTAVEEGFEVSTRYLLQIGASFSEATLKNENGTISPLSIAVNHDRVSIAEILLAKQPKSAQESLLGVSVLCMAVRNGNPKMVKLLIKHGADPKELVWGTPITNMAISEAHNEVLEVLLKAGCDPNAAGQGWVVKDGALRVSGEDDQPKANPGRVALHLAASKCNREAVKLLLDHGADARIKDSDGQTPLHFVAEPEVLSIQKEGIEARVDICQMLIKKGADVNAKDNEGRTPLDLCAGETHSQKIIEFLKSKGGVEGKAEKPNP